MASWRGTDRGGGPLTGAGGEGVAGFLLGAFGMFAAMYSTQAILPELARDFSVSPATAGLTVSAVVLAVAVGAWLWGPLSDRIGRPRAMRLASLLLVPPTLLVAVAPSFPVLVAARGLQGLCMPGLLVVGVPYVVETLVPRVGARAMGWYVGTLVLGGLVGRVGIALASSVVGWRTALGLLTALPLAASVAMRGLPDVPRPPRSPAPLRRVVTLPLVSVTVVASALFFAFVGTFTFVPFRLEEPPFDLSVEAASLVFLLWVAGIAGPVFGRLAERAGWLRMAGAAVGLSAVGVAVSIPARLVLLVPALACIAFAMFGGVTAAQLGLGEVAPVDRGTASAFYFSAYYVAGSVAAYGPGLAWEAAGWGGVVACDAVALGVAALAVVALARLPRPPVDAAAHGPYALDP